MSYLTLGALGISLLAVPQLYHHTGSGFLVTGEAGRSCGQYLEAANAERAARPPNPVPGMRYTAQYVIFVGVTDGFLTGINYVDQERPQLGTLSDANTRMAWLENYCKAHSSAGFVEALQYLRLELIQHGT
jgi:hypothetical protein